MVSTAFKQDGQDEIGGTFLRPGVLQRLRSGYEWGLLHKDEPAMHPQRFEPFLAAEECKSFEFNLARTHLLIILLCDTAARAAPKAFAIPPGAKARLSMEIVASPELSHGPRAPAPALRERASSSAFLWTKSEGQEPSFYLKRLEEMRKCHADLDDDLRALAATYLGVLSTRHMLYYFQLLTSNPLQSLGDEGNEFTLVEAGVSPNWSGRTRTLLLFKRQERKDKEVAEGEEVSPQHGMLVDIKPVRTDPDDKYAQDNLLFELIRHLIVLCTCPFCRLFFNPYTPDYGKRMLKAQDLYANGYIHHASTFFFKDVQYFAHEVDDPSETFSFLFRELTVLFHRCLASSLPSSVR